MGCGVNPSPLAGAARVEGAPGTTPGTTARRRRGRPRWST